MTRVFEDTSQSNNGKVISMTIFIYKISFPNNPKVYIGQTNNPKVRWNAHKRSAKQNSKQYVHSAMRKYGSENAIFEVIATCLECADTCEIQIIKQYDSFNNGYNMTLGGTAFPCGKDNYSSIKSAKPHYNCGRSPNKETRIQISKSLHGNIPHNKSVWKIYHHSGQITIVKDLPNWCNIHGYHTSGICLVYHGKQGMHKDIIKVEKIS